MDFKMDEELDGYLFLILMSKKKKSLPSGKGKGNFKKEGSLRTLQQFSQ